MDLTGFDPSTMTYITTQLQHPNVPGNMPTAPDQFHDMLLPAEYQDHPSTYGGYAGSDDFNLHAMSAAPPLKRYPSTYDDQFSDVVSAFDASITHENHESEVPAIERDHKLLSFSLASFDYTLLDYNFRRTTINITAQLHGMFFIAESPWTSAEKPQDDPVELTCYRRNLFQITGDVALPRTLRYILTDAGEQIPIVGQELAISATESTEGNPVKIISVPWKTPANPGQPAAEDKVEREPPSIPLDTSSVQDMHMDFEVFPFQWKRLQFRIATANNGRRKELQQHFVVRLKVMATLATGGRVPICQVQSGPIIVRGRSPRNFQSRKDLPLNGSGQIRKSSNIPGRSASADSTKHRVHDGGPTSVPPPKPDPPPAASSYYDSRDIAVHQDPFEDWIGTTSAPIKAAVTSVPQAFNSTPHQAGNVYAISTPDMSRAIKPFNPPSAPVNLSLVEDDSPQPGRNSSTTPVDRAAKRLQIPPRAPSFSLNTINSPDESADLLYEYFPLGLDDWMPPVDAVYRPHVVHHTKLPSDPRDPTTSAKSARSKRYFVEDVD